MFVVRRLKSSQVLVDRTQHPPFLHPTPLFQFFFILFFFHFHGLEICKTAIICRKIIAVLHISKSWKWKKRKKNEKRGAGCKKGGCCVLSTSTCWRHHCKNSAVFIWNWLTVWQWLFPSYLDCFLSSITGKIFTDTTMSNTGGVL